MKITSNGKRYDTANCETIAKRDHYNNGNYSGTTRLMRATNGAWLLWCNTNGQDCYLTDSISVIGEDNVRENLDSMKMDAEQEKLAVKYGLIEIIT